MQLVRLIQLLALQTVQCEPIVLVLRVRCKCV